MLSIIMISPRLSIEIVMYINASNETPSKTVRL